VFSKGRLECLDQGGLAEWLEQALNGTVLQQARADGLIAVSRDEDNWNLRSTTLKLPLQFGATHARHGDVEDQAWGLTQAVRREELLGGLECPGRKAELLQQVRQ
jgi:hypothetical protein